MLAMHQPMRISLGKACRYRTWLLPQFYDRRLGSRSFEVTAHFELSLQPQFFMRLIPNHVRWDGQLPFFEGCLS